MLRRFSINFAIFSMLMDAICVFFGLKMAEIIRPFMNGFPYIKMIPEQTNLPAGIYISFALIWVSLMTAFSIYDGRKYLRVIDEYSMLTVASLIASISMAGILYLSYRQISRALFVLFVLISYLLLLIWRGVARLGFRLRKDYPDVPRRVLIIGAGPLGERVGNQIQNSRIENMECIGYVDEALQIESSVTNLLGEFGDIRTIIDSSEITDVVIALPYSVYERMTEIVNLITDMPVKVWVALGFNELALFKTNVENFAGIPMLDLRSPALGEYQRMIKRGFDLILGTIALVLALPLMVLISLAILLLEGWPVIFKQKRSGENGRTFDIYKFRTMVRDADKLKQQVEKLDLEGNLVHKSVDDPRITPIGRFLRRFSLDELPQLFNVILGSMSLIGPRPELPDVVEKYEPWQRKRFAVSPGMTGWWQVNGRSNRMMHLHTEDDLYYINNYSLWLDIQILIRTIWAVLLGRGAF